MKIPYGSLGILRKVTYELFRKKTLQVNNKLPTVPNP